MEQLISIGVLIVMIGIVLVIAGSILTAIKSKKTKTEWSVVGLIGPLPVGFSSNKKMLLIGFAILVIFILLFIILNLIRR